MKASGTTSRIAIVVGTFAVFVALASSAQAASARPAGMTKAEYQALMTRSEALNERYGNAVTRLPPDEFAAIWNAGGYRLAPQQLVALVTRGEAINEAYRRWKARQAQSGLASDSSAVVSDSRRASRGFGWSEAGIGAAAMLGVVLLAGGLFAATRHRPSAPTARVS
jgi:hypothetical protein